MADRETHAKAILGADWPQHLRNTRVLIVGSGGIGCELLKNVVLAGFGHITLLDLDTIDLSNLNRQFLFRKKDVKQPKATVAARTAAAFNPSVHIDPICANIKEGRFDVDWFAGFDVVMSALDNTDARKHINRMALAAGVPVVESGTQGYFGQVQPIVKDRTECFECMAKGAQQKTYPVCTIRSTPSQPIHCIVWAKSYLLPQLFGEEEDEGELDEAEKMGENATEIATLRREAQAFKRVRAALRTRTRDQVAGRIVFQKVFNHDIENLLSMEDMWRTRERPEPLDYDAILSESFVLRGEPQTRIANVFNGVPNGTLHAGLKDQQALTLPESLDLLISSIERLSKRLKEGEDTITFDKDDDDTLDFVTAASNLRSAAYNIPQKNRWDVKEMAGNIIPAIATTNAIIAGIIVLQTLHLLRQSYEQLSLTFLQTKHNKPLNGSRPAAPNPNCAICRDTYTTVHCNPAHTTLRDVVEGILGQGEGHGTGPRDVTIYEAGRILADPDFEDNLDRTLADLNCGRGKFITIVDEDGVYGTINVAICLLPHTHLLPPDTPQFILPDPLPIPPSKPMLTPPRETQKRKEREDDDNDGFLAPSGPGPTPKKLKGAANGYAPSQFTNYTPSKVRRLEEEGLVLLEEEETISLD